MNEENICWYCKREQTPTKHWDKKVILDKHHISYTGKKRRIYLCKECHDRLHSSRLHRGRIAFRGAVRNPYFLFVLDNKMTIEEARKKLSEGI